MSSLSRWGGTRIVGPLDKNTREKDLIGGLKNALERGHPLENSKQSFLNAGYTEQEITSAIGKVSVPTATTSKAKASVTAPSTPKAQAPTNNAQAKTQTQAKVAIPNQESAAKATDTPMWMKIAMGVLIVLILIGAGLTFFFRARLF